MASVEIYTKGHCPYCHRAKMLLDAKKVSYQEYKIDEQPQLRPEMIERSGGVTVPQIIINNKPIGGCDELFALQSADKLDALLTN
ncbi:MAG: glutaredoxin 3 [Thalassotalea sp.]